MSDKFLKFSFSLPVYNEEAMIKECLDSIACQDYPQDKIEVLLVDGESIDKTVEIASKYKFVKIFSNPKRLADFGAKIAAKEATGELFVAFAADNSLVGRDWLKTINQIFLSDKDISTFWCKMIPSPGDSKINRYYELIQNDPLSFCISKNLGRYLKKASRMNFDGRTGYLFEIEEGRSLIWGANGLTYRTAWVRDIILRKGFLGDNDVFQVLIEGGKNKVIYFKDLFVCHHHLRSLSQWVSKWRRNYVSHFLQQRKTRNLGWIVSRGFKTKVFLWAVYSIIPVFSLAHALWLMIRDRNIYWLYHPVVSFFQAATYIYLTLTRPEGRKMIREFLRGGKV